MAYMKRIGADPTGCDHINYASHSDSGKSLGLADFGLAEDTRKRVAILSIDLNNQSAQVRMLAAKQILQIIEPGNPRNTRTRELYTWSAEFKDLMMTLAMITWFSGIMNDDPVMWMKINNAMLVLRPPRQTGGQA